MQEKGCAGFLEAYSECLDYFLASLIKNSLVKAVFARYYLKLSLPMFLKCFLIVAYSSLMFLIEIFLI